MVRTIIKTTILTLTGATLLWLSNASVFAVGESASLSSSGVNFEITPTSANPNGTVAIGADELTVSSTCSSGYKLYISTTSNEEGSNTLENTDIEDSSSTTAPTSIPITSGTISSPTLLNAASSKNHWGFAMASGDTGIASTGFDASTNATVTNNSLFASIPLLDNMSTIRQKTSSADNETVNVYYGVNVGTDLAPGSYSSTVMYTMVMPSPCDYTLMFEDGVFDSDPIESEVTKMPESTNIGRNTSVNLGDYVNEFSREGYSITGWKNLTDNLTYGANDTVNINTTNSDIIKLAPIWTINNYTVSINTVTGISTISAKIGSGSGTEVNNVSKAVQYGTTVTISYTESEGHHFTGWEIKNVDTDSEGNPLLGDDDITQLPSTDAYTFTMPASNVELSPKAEGNKYTVHFNANGGTGTMNDVEMTYGSPSTLPENTFAYDGYDFYGWSKTKQDPSLDPTRDYTDGQTGVFNLTTSNPSGTGESTLYAVWKIPLVYDDIMQNWTGCTSLTISTTENYENSNTYADLLDTRNNVVYRVRRYNDDACWMAQNLRATPGNSDPGNNTIASGTLAAATDTSQGAGEIKYANNGFSTSTWSTSLGYYNGNTINGAYYTLTAALVICPAGWTLPTSSQYSAFLSAEKITNDKTGIEKIQNKPYEFPISGAFIDSSLINLGSYGLFWTSTQYEVSRWWNLYLRAGYEANLNPLGDLYYGYTVRCVQANSTTMQSFTASQCAELTPSTTDNYEDKSTYRVLRDTRNSVFYTIRKYADEKCWMANNLRVTPGTTDPGTSTVSSGTLTTNTSTSQAVGSVDFTSSFSTNSYTAAQGIYKGSADYGAYYTWSAALVVCPAGWTLPTNNQYSTFLFDEGIANSPTGSTKMRSVPYNFTYAGSYYGSSLSGDGSYGHNWSSVQYGSSNGYLLYFDNSGASVLTNDKRYGLSVRCLHS